MRVYRVDLLVLGAVETNQTINFNTEKELDLGNIFRSDIIIKKNNNGFLISSTVFTSDKDRAYKVALLFIGKMLDVLSIRTNLPLTITNTRGFKVVDDEKVRAIIEEDEFRYCFELARQLNIQESKLLRAFSWYRKGLYTDDSFDKFLSLWNSICVIADGYCNDTPRTRQGIINKIWDCFLTIWGDCENWEHIGGRDRWIQENNEIRNKIAHGGVTVDINYVENVINQLDLLQNVSYSFLVQWSNRLGRDIGNACPLNNL